MTFGMKELLEFAWMIGWKGCCYCGDGDDGGCSSLE